MNELVLFAGAGGGVLGTKLLGFTPVCYVEIDAFCQRILRARIADGFIADAPIWDDARTFDGKPWRGVVDLVSAGFPCQPFSEAGRKLGAGDARNLWPATARIVAEVRPAWVLLENVTGLVSSGYLAIVIRDLASLGYVGRWGCLSACAVGAPHVRQRLWIVAHANCLTGGARLGIHPSSSKRQIQAQNDEACHRADWLEAASRVARGADGVADGVDRRRVVGEGQVPRVVEVFWRLVTHQLGGVGDRGTLPAGRDV